MRIIKRPSLSTKGALFVALLVVLIGVFIGWYAHNTSNKSTQPKTSDPTINLKPPTVEDKQAVQQTKENIPSSNSNTKTTDSDTSAQQQSSPKNANVIVTYAGQYDANIEAAARVTNIFEDNGTCTFSFQQGTKTIARKTVGVKNVKDTACPAVSISRSEFPQAGNWELQVTYESSTISGTAVKQTIEVK